MKDSCEEVELLLSKVPADVSVTDKWGRTPLHLAMSREMVELLVAKGANPNARDEDDATPLHLAAPYPTPEVYEALLDHGADPSLKNKHGATPAEIFRSWSGTPWGMAR
jgi:ankyrin repeat protein